MTSAIVLLNCRFPFDATIPGKVSQFSAVSNVYRTSGVYDVVLKVTADTESELHKVVADKIGRIANVDSALTMIIAPVTL